MAQIEGNVKEYLIHFLYQGFRMFNMIPRQGGGRADGRAGRQAGGRAVKLKSPPTLHDSSPSSQRGEESKTKVPPPHFRYEN